MKKLAIVISLFAVALVSNAQDCASSMATINDLPFIEVGTSALLMGADSLALVDEPCNLVYKVSSFEVHVADKVFSAKGNRMTDEMKKTFATLQDGATVVFENIKTQGRKDASLKGELTALSVQILAGEGN